MTYSLLHSSGHLLLCEGEDFFSAALAVKCLIAHMQEIPIQHKTEVLNAIRWLTAFARFDDQADLATEHWFVKRLSDNQLITI